MRMVCMSTSGDIATGMRLSGVETFVIKDFEKAKQKMNELCKDENVGILGLTEDIYENLSREIKEYTKINNLPLIVELPNTKRI